MDYEGQFVLTKHDVEVGEHWRSLSFGKWIFRYHPMLRVQKIVSGQDDHLIGCISGFFYPDQDTDTVTLQDVDEAAFESYVYAQPGHFIAIYAGADTPHVYLDPSGSLPVVYSEKYEGVASSPGLFLGEDYDKDFNKELYQSMGMPEIDFWYPGTITPHFSVKRLLPNHYLEVDSWKSYRHWPKPDSLEKTKTNGELVAVINEQIKQSLLGASEQRQLCLALTAGRDSRCLLSAAGDLDILDKLSCYTFTDRIKGIDEIIAQKITSDHHLDWKLLPLIKANKQQSRDWLKKVGHAVSGPIMKNHMALSILKDREILVQGSAAQVGRAFYLKKSDQVAPRFTTQSLLNLLKLPQVEEFHQSCAEWLEEVETYDLFVQLDLLSIEIRLGCWGGPQVNGNLLFGPVLYPLSNRKIFNAMMQLDRDYRVQQKLMQDMIKLNWPELMKYPFNQHKGWQHINEFMYKVSLVPGFIRKRMKLLKHMDDPN
ncbi:MAG TPA: hypothetical protein VKA34_00435 [Balneolales bacterium]|nr:hypothetical protein [Balneolales bacterium]